MLAPAYVVIAIAVFAAGGEFSGGQVRTSLLAVPDRHRLLTAKLVVTVAAGMLGALLAVLPGYLVQHAAAVVGGDLTVGAALTGLAASVVCWSAPGDQGLAAGALGQAQFVADVRDVLLD